MRFAGSVESWSVGAARWQGIARMQPGWYGKLLLAPDSGLVTVGGHELGLDARTIANVDRLDLRRAEWTPLTSLGVDRYCATAIAFGRERWVVAGGLSSRGEGLTPTDAVEIVDASVGAAERLPAIPFACAEPLLAVLDDGCLLVAGGYADDVGRSVAVYSVSSGVWEARGSLPGPRAASTGPFEIDDRYSLWIGGWDSFEHDAPPPALLLDRHTAVVSEVSLHVPRGACVVELAKGALLVAGGRANDGGLLATTEIVRVEVRR